MTSDWINQVVATSLPYVFALFVIAQRPLVSSFAARALQAKYSSTNLPDAVEAIAVEVSEEAYRHVSFFTSVLTACVAAMAFSLLGGNPLYAVLVAVYLLGVLYLWLNRWLHIASPAEGAESVRWMLWIETGTVVLLLMLSLWYNVFM